MPNSNDNTKAIEIESASYSEVFDPEGGIQDKDFIVITIGTSKRCINKYELAMPSFNVEKAIADGATLQDLSDWMKEQRNLDLQSGINTMLRSLSTRPAYDMFIDKEVEPTVTPDPLSTEATPKADFVDYPLKENGHAQMQTLLDGYKAGQRPTGEKKQQAQLGAAVMGANKDNALTPAEIQELIAKAAAKKAAKAGK